MSALSVSSLSSSEHIASNTFIQEWLKAVSTKSQVIKFKDGSTPIPYPLYVQALLQAFDRYRSSDSNHRFDFSLLTLIAEYEDELTDLIPNSPIERQFVSSIGFGKKIWNDYFGDIGDVPPIPKRICKILTSECPFFAGKTVQQTHILTLVPASLDKISMTLKRFGELMTKLGKPSYRYPLPQPYADASFEPSHWILITSDALQETRNKSFEDQKKMIASHSDYQVPKLTQVITAIFMEDVATRGRKETSTGTRCQEQGGPFRQMIVGYLETTNNGLIVGSPPYGGQLFGIKPLRKV